MAFNLKKEIELNNFEEVCCIPGCMHIGKYPAPRDPEDVRRGVRAHIYFCITHVREYNRQWNYYADMNDAMIEADRKEDVHWRRPTWENLNKAPSSARFAINESAYEALNNGEHVFFDIEDSKEYIDDSKKKQTFEDKKYWNKGTQEAKAVDVLGLKMPLALKQIKLRYKALVKSLHPDTNDSDDASLERLKEINRAYSILQAAFNNKV